MPEIELLVKLKIPDTTAITAFHTLHRMGFAELVKLVREDYYLFEIDGSIEKFTSKIGNVDVLVNANKHSFIIQSKDKLIENKKTVSNTQISHILVQSIENDCTSLLHTLRQRLSLKEINKMEKGILWTLEFSKGNNVEISKKIAQDLLVNENYQKYKVFT